MSQESIGGVSHLCGGLSNHPLLPPVVWIGLILATAVALGTGLSLKKVSPFLENSTHSSCRIYVTS